MYCFSAFRVLLCMILYQLTPVVYLQTLTLTLETSPLRCTEEVTLKCLYSGPTCCTDDARVWTFDGTQIMSNGAASDNAKYREERNDASLHFDMKISKPEDSDFNKIFQCKYNFQTSNTVTLTKDITYECFKNESCSFHDKRSGGDKVNVEGSVVIEKAAPLPLLYAFYGEDNLTSGLSVVKENYDTWYYSINVTSKGLDCMNRIGKMFTVTSVTGTNRKKICEVNLCECEMCFAICYGLSCVLHIIGSGYLVILIILKGMGKLVYKKGCDLVKVKLITLWHFILYVILITCFACVVGIPICPCNESLYMLFLLMLPMITGPAAILILHLFYKFDHTCFFEEGWRKAGFVILWFVSGGVSLIAACAMDAKWFKGKGTKEDPVKVYVKQGCEAVLTHKDNVPMEWAKKEGNEWKTIDPVEKKYKVSTKPALFKKIYHNLHVVDTQPDDDGIYSCAGKSGKEYFMELILLGKDGKEKSEADMEML